MFLRNRDTSRSFAPIILRTALALVAVGLIVVGLAVPSGQPAQASSGINSTINFQGRLLSAAGAVVADGNYNVEFKIYSEGDGKLAGDAVDGSVPAGTLLWTEDWLNSNSTANPVVVKNGYFSVNLGTSCPLTGTSCTGGQTQAGNTAVNFNDNTLWLSMNVAGPTQATGSCLEPFASNCAPDTEMLPMDQLGAAPYAENAANADQVNSYGVNNNLLDLSVPVLGSPTLVAGGTLSTIPYYYEVTALNSTGETLGSASATATPSAGNLSIKVPWTVVPGATSYKIYRNTSNVFTSGSLYLTTVTNGSLSSYTDTGAISPTAGFPPTTTTGSTLIIQGWNGQTANLQQLENSAGSTVMKVDTSGNLTAIGPTTTLGQAAAASSLLFANTSTTATLGFSGTATATGGTLFVTGQTGATTNNGGAITVTGGTAGSTGTTNTGGLVTIQGGAAGATAGSIGGAVDIYGAAGTSTGTGGVGGAVNILSGAGAGSLANNAGTVTIDSGAPISGGLGLINIGTTNATTTTIGSATSFVNIFGNATAGGGITLNSTTNGYVNIGTGYGGVDRNNTIDIGGSNGSNETSTVNIANTTNNYAETVNIGTNGSGTNSASDTVHIQGGTGVAALQMGVANNGQITIGDSANTGTTQTIKIGASTQTTTTNNVTIGSTIAGSTILQGSGITDTITGSTENIKTSTNSATGFQLQNTGGFGVLTGDTTSNGGQGQVILGASSHNNGALVFDNTAGVTQVTLATSVLNTNTYTLLLPVAAPSGGGQCLTTSSATQLLFGSCATGGLVQAPISNSPGATGANWVQPATTLINGLTINGTNTGTGATSLVVVQAGTGTGTPDAQDINVTDSSGTVTNALAITKTNAGALTDGINITGTTTIGTGLQFGGTVTTDIGTASGSSGTPFTLLTGNGTSGTAGSLSLDNGTSTSGTPTLSIGTAGYAHTINIGNGAAANAVTLGSTTSGASDALQGGTTTENISNNGDLVQTNTNTTNAFQVQDASGEQLLGVNTTNPVTDVTNNQNVNEISNGSFEAANATTGWAAASGATLAQTTTQAYVGSDSMSVTTTAAANDGAKYNLTTSTLVSNTTYTLTMYARSFNNGGNWTTMQMGYYSGSAATNCLTTQTVYWYGWTKYQCTFTTGTTSGTPYVFMEQSDASVRTFYIDGIQLQRWSLLANAGMEQSFAGNWTAFGGAVVTQSATYADAGTDSAKIVTNSGVTNEGAEDNITLTPNTLYSLYLYINGGGATLGNDLEIGYYNGTTYTPCMTNQPTSAATWSYYYCSFTSPSSNSGSPYMYIDDNSVKGSYTFYADQVQLNVGTYLGSYQDGQVAINGTVNSPLNLENSFNSTNALQVQTAQGVQQFDVDTTDNLVSFLQEADITSAAGGNPAFYLSNSLTSPAESIRLRVNSNGANVESGGKDLFLSGWSDAAMSATQYTFARGSLTTGDLYVGNAGGTGNNGGPTALVLDNSSTAPTEQDGGMYYSTTDNTFECGDNGSWTSCGNGVIESMTADSSPGLTTASYANFNGASWTPPAGDCQPGVSYIITADGFVGSGTAGLSIAMDFALYQSGTDLEDMHNESTLTSVADTNYHSWTLNMTVTCQSLNSAMIQGFATSDGNRGSGMDSPAGNARTGVIALTSGGTFQLEGRWRTTPTGSGFAIVMTNLVVQRLAP